ncbi:Hypothetical protein BJL86_0696 [Dietzia timorensis]|uniref:Uncharacterized protein n=1 Tax=Dietzia timorensis TaxID=499555 RepID=A0A173LIZ3_9ACTN|nr:Hypothetical protein BJL86_0696 [Dietzia timorensis]
MTIPALYWLVTDTRVGIAIGLGIRVEASPVFRVVVERRGAAIIGFAQAPTVGWDVAAMFAMATESVLDRLGGFVRSEPKRPLSIGIGGTHAFVAVSESVASSCMRRFSATSASQYSLAAEVSTSNSKRWVISSVTSSRST